MHLYYKDLFKECFEYAKSMPEYADIYLTVVDEEGKKLAENIFQNLKCNKLEVLLIENRGRDVSSLLVAGKNFYDKYDYICFTHDKKTSQVKPHSQGKSFAYKCFENSLATKDFVENVITTFEENPKLGILSPTPPNNGVFYGTFGTAWFENFENTVTLAKELNLKVDLDVNKRPMAPLGTMFWFRVISMKKLFDRNWNYKDFPKEPMGKNDGTILNAIERLYPFVCQDAGYYAGYLFTDRFASNEITNLHYTMDEIGKRIRVWNIYELLITISNLQNHYYNQILKTKILLRAIKTYLKYKIRKIFKKK
jgi:rhamnosyltransferase